MVASFNIKKLSTKIIKYCQANIDNPYIPSNEGLVYNKQCTQTTGLTFITVRRIIYIYIVNICKHMIYYNLMYIHGLMLPFIGISKLKETLLDKKKTINYLEN